jgi:RimJ/RimL family protein N-acetyltransferase
MAIKEEKIRISPIVKADLMAVFGLSNQKSVRTMSFNQEKIKLADHRRWFAKKLDDKNTVMIKASIGDILVGQARLDIESKKAVIGVSTSEKYRGRGIATMLINKAISAAAKRDLSRIDAFIKPENLGSQALFEKLGWAYRGQEELSGNKALKYSLKIKTKDGPNKNC